MAFRLRYWLGAVLAGAALIAVWMLPVGSFGRQASRPLKVDPARRIAEELSAETRTESERLLRLRWLDSLTTELDHARSEGRRVATGVPEAYRRSYPEDVASVDASVGETLRADDAGAPETGYAAGFYLVAMQPPVGDGSVGPLNERTLDGRTRRSSTGVEYYAGTTGLGPYCVALRGVDYLNRRFLRRSHMYGVVSFDHLGPCRYFLRYGEPGPEVGRWLRAGGAGFGLARRLGERPPRRFPRLAFAFGRTDFSPQVGVAKCIQGALDVCASLVSEPAAVGDLGPGRTQDEAVREAVPQLLTGQSYSNVGHLGTADVLLFDDLEREFGALAFERFWKSDQNVAPAFEDAFGTPLGRYVQARAVGEFRPEVRGHPLSAANVLMALLAIGVALGLAVATEMRRRVA